MNLAFGGGTAFGGGSIANSQLAILFTKVSLTIDRARFPRRCATETDRPLYSHTPAIILHALAIGAFRVVIDEVFRIELILL